MTKKRVAMAINYDYHDYGGMLQAYASQRALIKLGIEAEAINYDNLKRDINKRKWKYFLSNIMDSTIVKEKSRIINKRLKEKIDKSFGKKMAIRDMAFDRFCNEKFKVTRKYKTWEELHNACKDYDAIIVGSDQLWLPSNVVGDYYTLNFVPDDVNKVAYATSFGIGAIPAKMKNQYTAYLKRINYLSAREISGQEIIKQCTGRDVPLVCDPTMLLEREEWNSIARDKRIIEDDYIFCYFMGDNPEQREFVKQLAQKENCKIVALLHLDQYIASDENYVDIAPYDIDPSDFVNLVKNSKFVCTDSFHGTVFSIIFSKDFFTFKRFNKKASLSTNTRLVSLLGKLGLNERLYDGSESVDGDIRIHNYPVIQKELKIFRDKSINYFVSSIES